MSYKADEIKILTEKNIMQFIGYWSNRGNVEVADTVNLQSDMLFYLYALKHYKRLAEERGAALEWYADEDHYTDGDIGYLHNKSTVEYDGGERARKALGKEPQP